MDNKDVNSPSASSFGTDSFASFEKSGADNEFDIPFISVDTPADEPDGSTDCPAPEGATPAANTPEEPKAPEAPDVSEGADSFGDETFASYEGKPTARPKATDAPEEKLPEEEPKKQSRALNLSGWVTFFACFPACFIGLIITVVSFFAGRETATVPLCVLLAISVSSIVLGVLLNRNKSKNGNKNIVVGAIATFFLFMMLVSSFGENDFDFDIDLDDDTVDEEAATEALVKKAGKISGIQFPEYDYYYYSYYDGDDNPYKSADLDYSLPEDEALYTAIKANGNFVDSIPTAYIGLLPAYDRSGSYDHYLIYNTDTGEFNTMPSKDGTANLLCILVYCDEEYGYFSVNITEYSIEYVSGFPSDI